MADAKITALTEDTSVRATDLVPTVEDPSGTPVTKKVQVGNLVGTSKSWLCIPAAPVGTAGTGTLSIDTETSMICGAIFLPFHMIVDTIEIEATTVNAAGTLDLTIYSEDGQTRHIAITTASISAAGIISTSAGGVALKPGIYFACVNCNGATADIVIRSNALANIDIIHTPGGGRIQYCGIETITADTPPATLDTTTFNSTATNFALFRFTDS